VQLFGEWADPEWALRAQEILAEKYQIAADVWSVTSYTELRGGRRLRPSDGTGCIRPRRSGRRISRRRWRERRADRCGERLYEVAARCSRSVVAE